MGISISSPDVFKMQIFIMMIFIISPLRCQKRCKLEYEMNNTRLINHYHESDKIKSLNDCENYCLHDPKCDAFNWKVSTFLSVLIPDDIRCFLYKEREFSFRSNDVDKFISKVCKVTSLVSIGKPYLPSSMDNSKPPINSGLYDFEPNERDKNCVKNLPYWRVDLLAEYEVHFIHVWGTIDTRWSINNLIVYTSLTEDFKTLKEFGRVTEDNEYRYDFGKRIYVVKYKNGLGTLAKIVHLQMENKTETFALCIVEVFGDFIRPSKDMVLLKQNDYLHIKTSDDISSSNGKLAYDGNKDQLDVNNCFVSKRGKPDSDLFWSIELTNPSKIMMVRIYNQGKCCGHHFTSIIVSVRDLPNKDWKNCAKFYGAGATMRIYDFGCNYRLRGIDGSTVKVEIDRNKMENDLIICEVEIFAAAE